MIFFFHHNSCGVELRSSLQRMVIVGVTLIQSTFIRVHNSYTLSIIIISSIVYTNMNYMQASYACAHRISHISTTTTRY